MTKAHKLAAEGKAVVWIDGGSMPPKPSAPTTHGWVYQMVSRTTTETSASSTTSFCSACTHNPDGQELVANWYMRDADPKKPPSPASRVSMRNTRATTTIATSTCPTCRKPPNENRVLYREWFPQIMYNHHQTGPAAVWS